MTSGSTVDAEHLATMIVDVVEAAQRYDHHLGLDDLCARVSGFSAAVGSNRIKRTLIIASRRCAEIFVTANCPTCSLAEPHCVGFIRPSERPWSKFVLAKHRLVRKTLRLASRRSSVRVASGRCTSRTSSGGGKVCSR